MPLEIAAASHSAPWWVLGAVGVFMIPLVFTAVWKWFLKGKAEMSVMELSQAQGGIYRTAITDSAEIIKSLQASRDQAEQKYTDLLRKLADVTDQLVDMHGVLSAQTDQIRQQSEQLEKQSQQLDEAKVTIERLTAQIQDLEGRLNAAPN